MVVAPRNVGTNASQQATTTLQTTTNNPGTYNIKLSGTLMMNVRGDKGRITEIDMKDLLETSTFKEYLAVELAKALAEAESRRGTQTPTK